jgi:hypothetical protein
MVHPFHFFGQTSKIRRQQRRCDNHLATLKSESLVVESGFGGVPRVTKAESLCRAGVMV